MSDLVAAGANLNYNSTGHYSCMPLYAAAREGHAHATLALVIGGAPALDSGMLASARCAPDIRALLHPPPPAPPLVAAQLRLSFSGLCHQRLGSASLIKFVSGDVVGHVGHFVGVADVYRARVRQANSMLKLRASTSGDSDEVAHGA